MQPAFRPIPRPRFEFSFLILAVLAAFCIVAFVQVRGEWRDAQRGLLLFERTQADALIDLSLLRASHHVRAPGQLAGKLDDETVIVEARGTRHAYVGTGVVVGKSNGELDILTAHHVVDHTGTLLISFRDGTTSAGRVVASSKSDDLSVIRVRAPQNTTIRIARISDADFSTGQAFVVVGHPGNHDWAATPGLAEPHIYTTLLFCPKCDRGDSGAGAFDMQGRLRGIVTKKLTILLPGARAHDAIVAFTTVRPDRIRAIVRRAVAT